MSEDHPVIIAGAGHAGVQMAASLREEGYKGKIVLACDEAHAPYQRPPLSKAYMKGAMTRDGLALRGPAFYEQQGIETAFGDKIIAIDRAAKSVRFASGRVEPYSHLVLATGARARPAPFPGADLAGVVVLRNLDDADALKAAMNETKNVVVIGAGFIGLEFAATAAAAGKNVTIVESAPRVMGRAISAIMSDFFANQHRAFGSALLTSAMVSRIAGESGRAVSVELADGKSLPAEIVLLGIGVLAEDQLARDAGLACSNGVDVDDVMTTSDPAISAIGDCACHPNVWGGASTRLESVQNAADQARVVARRIMGRAAAYDALPWFWSDQGDLKLQIAGLLCDADTFVTRGDPGERSFSVFAFKGPKLCAVESVNRGGDHMAARKIIGEKRSLSPAEAADTAFDLKALAMGKKIPA